MASSALVTSFSFAFFRKAAGYMSRFLRIETQPVKVLVTGAAGEIGNAIVPMIARGLMLGANQPVILHMLDTDAEALEEFKMELIDAAFPLLEGVVATNDAKKACKDVNVAVMIGVESVSTFEDQASALGNHADRHCKVLVVANPAEAKNLCKIYAGSIQQKNSQQKNIQPKNITYLTRLEHNRALGRISEKAEVHVRDVKNVIIRENDDSTLYVDVDHAIVTTSNGEKSVKDHVADDHWFHSEFMTAVLQRDAARARKRSSALSAASSACDHVRDWLLGTPEGTCFSMGVYSGESYGSFPATCDGTGEWFIKEFDETTKKPIKDKK
ncbi:malate dehydrogenase, cytoplasmic-like [Ziziphus jujuba]|uniref:Malate dehydrogenase, cytoplasmic-like n=1 Tax=Ziziphus jujuba TaxID=326968 RepID=A0ABM3ISI2_ZIZJJ|nr:malate dehydrogenase, cytoplasmic-like [Ziziphus jujuba]